MFGCLVLPLAAKGQRLTILLDPARGGTEEGARIDEHTAEKQVTLDVANRLKSLLSARDFDVVLTRSSDVLVTNDARAALANQSKAIACISIHATASGRGLHLFTSSLTQAQVQGYAVPWDEAQSMYIQRSQRLVNELSTAFGRSKIPVSSGRTWIRPLDNMECPAVAVEIAPDGDGDTAADRSYQNRIADTIAGAMLFWRGHTDVVQSILAPPPPPAPEKKPAAPAAQPGGTPKSENQRLGAPNAASAGTAAIAPTGGGITQARPKPLKVTPAAVQGVVPEGTAARRPVPAKPKPKPVPVPNGVPE